MSRTIVILNFHGVGRAPADRPEESEVWVQKALLKEALDYACQYSHVRITFDDGNRSDIDVALPLLRERNLHASFFVLAGRLSDDRYLSYSDLALMVAEGMAIGSHGMHHRAWVGLDNAGRQEELIDARAILEDASGSLVTKAACPFGAYNRSSLHALAAAGFASVYTSDGAPAREDAWLQARYSLRAWHTRSDLEMMILDRVSAVKKAVRGFKCLVKRLR